MAKKIKRKTPKGAVEKFLKATTLHGFKYLSSKYCSDRVGWFICCCASACCAGVLCAVLWDRFLQIPALLALRDIQSPKEHYAHRLPVIAVCPPAESIAELLVGDLTTDEHLMKRLPLHLAYILEGKPMDEDQHLLLDGLLTENVSLPDLMFSHMPPCREIIKKCRWQGNMLPCHLLFVKTMTSWGICCVMQSTENLTEDVQFLNFQSTSLELALQCTTANGSMLYGCKFGSKYDGEALTEPVTLTPGYNYMAQLRFTSISESEAGERFIDDTCVSRSDYTTTSCLDQCAEKSCGCRDPLRYVKLSVNSTLPVCNITRLDCLRSSAFKSNLSCNCLPPCKKVTTAMTFESSPMNFIKYTYDSIYSGLNATSSIVIHFRTNIGLSRLFMIQPTETWLTLLSSLGGVFNMFLGVGLFSALELLFFLLVQLPKTMRKTPKVVQSSRTTRY